MEDGYAHIPTYLQVVELKADTWLHTCETEGQIDAGGGAPSEQAHLLLVRMAGMRRRRVVRSRMRMRKWWVKRRRPVHNGTSRPVISLHVHGAHERA